MMKFSELIVRQFAQMRKLQCIKKRAQVQQKVRLQNRLGVLCRAPMSLLQSRME
ncbi:hypothetical protein [Herbaspirillum huttiense]|uniref:Uncharacterized protein n=2 Tax=Herbaspirillum huttiense TaxID=863372 RepID=A0AAJ2LUN2_9BURK|nr:hypothetical protein [Herbaspirillum huttiense]MDR9835743.1 hypothetical protein [Herbaspirillum huttiense]